jgi:hypothetical protein
VPGSPEDVENRKALLWRTAVSVVDFGEALSYWGPTKELKITGNNPGMEDLVALSMRASAIVAFARPFLGSESSSGVGRDRLFLEQITPGYETSWWINLHSELIRLRDKFIAHSDSGVDARNPKVQVQWDGDGSGAIHLEMDYFWHHLEALDHTQVMQLFHHLQSNAESLAFRLAAGLVTGGHLPSSALMKPDKLPTRIAGSGVGTATMRLERGKPR